MGDPIYPPASPQLARAQKRGAGVSFISERPSGAPSSSELWIRSCVVRYVKAVARKSSQLGTVICQYANPAAGHGANGDDLQTEGWIASIFFKRPRL